jgi:tRNA(Leu) C34 or U34 (ribose-2'-O)-methylase TrmL
MNGLISKSAKNRYVLVFIFPSQVLSLILFIPFSQDLLSWLRRKKDEGYVIVGVEQTSSSQSLLEYKFSRRPTVLLLGKEKEGIPVDLLQIVDDCIEIPQLGIIRRCAKFFCFVFFRLYCPSIILHHNVNCENSLTLVAIVFCVVHKTFQKSKSLNVHVAAALCIYEHRKQAGDLTSTG